MTRTPLVSICIPTYNRASLLRESLRSVCAQDYQPLEILISDNASTDETEEICRRLESMDDRVRYIRQPRNIGLYGNHNVCITESRGTFLGLFHDDDLHHPEMVSRYVAFLLRHPEVGIVCSKWHLIDDNGSVIGTRARRVRDVIPGLEYVERTLRSGRSSIGIPGTLIRRSALGEIRFDENGPLGFGDFAVWFRIAETHSVGHLSEALWSYRQHRGSLSRRTIHSMTEDYFKVLTQYCDGHLERWPDHAEQVRRWREAIHRFLFWALAYEICLHFRGQLLKTPERIGDTTLFERMSYRLNSEELQEVRASLLKHKRGVVQSVLHALMEWMLRADLTWPLAQVARYPEPFRAILGLK